MNWIEFLYQLIGKHVMITKGELAQLKLECEQWWNSDKVKGSKIGASAHQYAEAWYVKTFLAILFLFASRWMLEFMNPDLGQDFDDDDDDARYN